MERPIHPSNQGLSIKLGSTTLRDANQRQNPPPKVVGALAFGWMKMVRKACHRVGLGHRPLMKHFESHEHEMRQQEV